MNETSNLTTYRNSDLRVTYTFPAAYDLTGFSPTFYFRAEPGASPLLTVSPYPVGAGSKVEVVGSTVVLTLKRLDISVFSDQEVWDGFFDSILTKDGFENRFVGGPMVQYADGSFGNGGQADSISLDFGGQVVPILIQGGNIGIGASVLLSDLNAAVEAAEAAADAAAASASFASNKVDLNLLNGVYTAPGGVGVSLPFKMSETRTPEEYGATGNGTTNDTAAFTAAANSMVNGGEIVCQRGRVYLVNNLTLPAGVGIGSASRYASAIKAGNPDGICINASAASIIRNINFVSVPMTLNGRFIDVQNGDNSVRVENCAFSNYYRAITVGTLGQPVVVGFTIEDCVFNTPSVGSGSGAIDLINYAGATVKNCLASTEVMTGQPDFGVRMQNGDTAYLVANNFTKHGRGILYAVATGNNVFATQVIAGHYDGAGTDSTGNLCSGGQATGGGNVQDCQHTGAWFGLSSASGFLASMTGAGTFQGNQFTGCRFPDNADCGFLGIGTGVKHINIVDWQAGGNGFADIRMAGAATDFTISQGNAGNLGRGASARGVYVDASASDRYIITGNRLSNCTVAGVTDLGTGTNKIVSGNLT